MTGVRYAIFFVPPRDGPLYKFGSSALGYDSYSGTEIASLSGDEFPDWRELTGEPRRYGFHATLKAPFQLQNECSEGDLLAQFLQFANCHAPPARFAATIRLFDGFAAVVPSVPVPALNILAASCVRDFDRFRGPMTAAERARRVAQPLTARQMIHLDSWGYPYVLDDFRFHMTLTGRLPPHLAIQGLKFLHRALKRQPVPCDVAVDTITLLRQAGPETAFRVIHSARLGDRIDPPSCAASRQRGAEATIG